LRRKPHHHVLGSEKMMSHRFNGGTRNPDSGDPDPGNPAFGFGFKRTSIWNIAIIATILCATLGYFITEIHRLPSHIQLLEGKANELRYDLPFKATIENESRTVLKVNHASVADNFTFDFNGLNVIEPDETGRATMTLNAFGFPVKKIALDILPDIELAPCGMAVGVSINTDGVMVLGTGRVDGEDGKSYNPSDGILRSGDLILKADDQELKSKDELMQIVRGSLDEINFQVKRGEELIEAKITPVLAAADNENKIGVWVRDGTQGIGTITYYNPATNNFAALGHGIMDVDTKQLMSIKSGEIRVSNVSSVIKGRKGAPGELIGEMRGKSVIGRVERNSPYGIFGSIDMRSQGLMPKERVKIGLQNVIHEGPAKILATIEGTDTRQYDIYIEGVNRGGSGDDTKGMVIRITDPELVMKTNGIVQGMSGSPIIQDEKIIGAVTHVFVQEPTKGYGIFIENMLKYEVFS
jgi:stage IV sporulation protein B